MSAEKTVKAVKEPLEKDTIKMKKYRQCLRSAVTVERNLREDIEWSNYWWDSANVYAGECVCIIGDLTARMVRKTLGQVLGMPYDLFATSAGLHDELFVSQLDTFFETGYTKYKAIFVRMGHHAEIGRAGGSFEQSDYQNYYEDYLDLIEYLKRCC